MDIFSYMYPVFKFKEKKVKLFEAFAGIGTQAMALKRLGVEVEHIGISEIDKYAIQAHRAIHGEVRNYGGIGEFEKLPPNIDICTWSFPCQDISLAGQQRGMDEGTRSNYGYVFLDTVKKMKKEERPKILLMENVEALVSSKFERDWEEIHIRLERMGYQSYSKVLEATDYGIPQTRRRIFVVSILGNYSYTFPKPFELKKKLKDYLEDEVDEKYYLSDKQIEQIVNWKAYNKPLENAKSENDETIQTITAKSNTSMNSSMILIKETTKQGYSIVEDGDGVYINRPHQKLGVVQKDKIQTLKTNPSDVGVVVERAYSNKSLEKIVSNIKDKNDVSNTITANPQRPTIDSATLIKLNNPLRIRKLTPLEAWRLMGISDSDFYKAQESGLSDSQLYKQAGNAIVVDVLVAIFKELF